MMQVEIREVLRLKARLGKINRLSLDDIEFVLDGVPVDVPQAARDRWDLTGLTNVDFVTARLGPLESASTQDIFNSGLFEHAGGMIRMVEVV